MGLDSVEMLVAFEHTFGVSIPDADAERMRTTRDVIEWLGPRLPGNPSQACGTQRAFHRVRAALVAATGASHADVVPSAVVRHLLPADDPGEAWSRLGRLLGASRWPRLPGRFGWHPTARELTHQIFSASPLAFVDPELGWSRGNIRAVVRAVVREETGVEDSFADDALFHEDLGLD